MGVKVNVMKKSCRNCGHVTVYNFEGTRYECMKRMVSPNGTCDRWTKKATSTEFMKKIDVAIKELEKYGDGAYQLKERPAFGQNYRILKDGEVE